MDPMKTEPRHWSHQASGCLALICLSLLPFQAVGQNQNNEERLAALERELAEREKHIAELEEKMAAREDIKVYLEEAQDAAREGIAAAREAFKEHRHWFGGNAEDQQPETYIGVSLESVPDVLRDYIDLPKGVGLLLTRIHQDSPAMKAGLKDNDILVEFDGQLIVNYSQLNTLTDLHQAGDVVKLKILRKGEEMTFDLTLEERIRQGSGFVPLPASPAPPAPPSVPKVPGAPSGFHYEYQWDDLKNLNKEEIVTAAVEEWLPGAVRIILDANEDVHVDLRDLREDTRILRSKIEKMRVNGTDSEDVVVINHGDGPARSTVLLMGEREMRMSNQDGTVEIKFRDGERYACVTDKDGNVVFDGKLPADYESALPPNAVKMIHKLNAASESIQFDSEGIDVEITTDPRKEISESVVVQNAETEA